MARRPRAPSLENRTSRLKLPRQGKPYFVTISRGIQLGYRRNKRAGSWVVRSTIGGEWTDKFATADDFEPANGDSVLDYWLAVDRARQLARGTDDNNGDRPVTVEEAIVDGYKADLAARDREITNATRLVPHLPAALAAKPVSLLTQPKELAQWYAGLVKKGLKPGTAKRLAKSLKAALNNAARNDARIVNSNVWRVGLGRLPDNEDAVRNVILADDVVRKIVKAAYEIDWHFGVLIETAATLGSRASQLLRVTVGDLQDDGPAPRLLVPCSRKGRRRQVEHRPLAIPPSLAQALRRAAGDNPAGATLLVRADGSPWRRGIDLDLFRLATAKVGLDASLTPYCLRHSAICRGLLAGVPTRVVAANADTSVPYLEKHYSRFIIGDPSDAITRRALLDMGQPPATNVVPIAGARS